MLTEFGSLFSTGKYGLKAFCVAKLCFFYKEIYSLLLRTNILLHFSSNILKSTSKCVSSFERLKKVVIVAL